MKRRDFLYISSGLIVLGGISVLGMAQESGHKEKKYMVIAKRCDGCGHCFKACREKALIVAKDGKPVIDEQKCKGCGDCTRFCRRMAIIAKEPGRN